jgi:hypothetical protein
MRGSCGLVPSHVKQLKNTQLRSNQARQKVAARRFHALQSESPPPKHHPDPGLSTAISQAALSSSKPSSTQSSDASPREARDSGAASPGPSGDSSSPALPGACTSPGVNALAPSSAAASTSGSEPGAAAGGVSLLSRLKQWLSFDKRKLASFGVGAFAAYGVISNLNATVLLTLAWMTVVKQVRSVRWCSR